MKLYFVQTMDEWSNITFIGIYDDLKKATRDVIETHKDFKPIHDLELYEYPSTFDMVFDAERYDENTGEFLRVFGYILTPDELASLVDIE